MKKIIIILAIILMCGTAFGQCGVYSSSVCSPYMSTYCTGAIYSRPTISYRDICIPRLRIERTTIRVPAIARERVIVNSACCAVQSACTVQACAAPVQSACAAPACAAPACSAPVAKEASYEEAPITAAPVETSSPEPSAAEPVNIIPEELPAIEAAPVIEAPVILPCPTGRCPLFNGTKRENKSKVNVCLMHKQTYILVASK